jgi:signal transduction histidine kinase
MIKGALGFFYDTTAEINTQRMRVDFIANISHEIKTPLTSLLGYSQMLQDMNLEKDPQTEKIVGKIVKNTEKINLLFTDLLNLSVIENKPSLIKKEIGLKEIIENSFEIVKKIYPEKCVALDLYLERDLILADEDLFGQIFNNLFDNSIKYSNEKEIIVTIKSLLESNHVKIIFSDNGPGIRTEDSDKIFQRFYRSHSKKHTIPGVGLGLSIVKQIIQKHGGNIRVSKAHPSLEFEINIPNI